MEGRGVTAAAAAKAAATVACGSPEGPTRRVSGTPPEEEDDVDDWSRSSVAFAGRGRVAGRATRRAERAARVVRKARRVGRGVPSSGCEVEGDARRARWADVRWAPPSLVAGTRRSSRDGARGSAGSRDRPRRPGITRDRENASDEHHIGARA